MTKAKPKKKRKPERTPQNKAMEAPENKLIGRPEIKQLIHSLHTNKPIKPPLRKRS